jgi:hypothetical protein
MLGLPTLRCERSHDDFSLNDKKLYRIRSTLLAISWQIACVASPEAKMESV